MFGTGSSSGYHTVLDGVRIKSISYGKQMIMTEFALSKGAELPQHQHVNEQTGYLVKGKIILHIGGTCKTLKPGDSWCIGSAVRHKAEILEDSTAVEVFSPVRDEYLKYIRSEDITE